MVKRLIMAVTFSLVLILNLCLITAIPTMASNDPPGIDDINYPAQPIVIVVSSGAGTLGGQAVHGQGYDIGDEIELYINGNYVATAIAEINGEGSGTPWFDTTDWGVMKPGDKVTLVDPEGQTADVTVASFIILGADLENETIWGMAKPGAWIVVAGLLSETGCFRCEVADANGFWEADFSVAGDGPGEETTCDIEDFWLCILGQADREYDLTTIWFQPSVTPQPIFTLATSDFLAKSYKGLKVAAEELGFSSVKDLQEAIRP